MTQAVAETRAEDVAAVVESVVIQGDLAKLQPAERVSYYRSVCESLGLNPLTKPFEYLMLNNRLPVERCCRTRPADHPRREWLAPLLRTEAERPQARPGGLSPLLQQRPGQHRTPTAASRPTSSSEPTRCSAGSDYDHPLSREDLSLHFCARTGFRFRDSEFRLPPRQHLQIPVSGSRPGI